MFFSSFNQGKQELSIHIYDPKNARRLLAIMIYDPLSIVHHVTFKRFVATLQLTFQIPSRNTMKK